MIFFENWRELGRVAISAPVVYLVIILFIRVSGKRSTSQMNNFDWIVTVALGSVVGSSIILKDVVLAEAFLAMLLLLGMQYCLTTLTSRFTLVANMVQATPTVLFLQGQFCYDAMRAERVNEQEVRSAIREAGILDLSEVGAVILETDANMSVLPTQKKNLPILEGIRGAPDCG